MTTNQNEPPTELIARNFLIEEAFNRKYLRVEPKDFYPLFRRWRLQVCVWDCWITILFVDEPLTQTT